MKIDKEQYIEYVKSNPNMRIQDIADHFGVKRSKVCQNFRRYGIKLKEFRIDNYHGISMDEIVEFASKHTMREIVAYYKMPSIVSLINRKKIPHLKKVMTDVDYHRESRRKIKCCGEDYEMMYILSRYYSLESIGRAFSVSREWVRIVCDDYDSGRRILTVNIGDGNE